ncbi:hypothetical protein M4Z11_05130, partial [Bartonella sp. G70]|nr:hypothetical protein [Bartonella sp. G70]
MKKSRVISKKSALNDHLFSCRSPLLQAVSLGTAMTALLSSVSPVVASTFSPTGQQTTLQSSQSPKGTGVISIKATDKASKNSLGPACTSDRYCGVDNIIVSTSFDSRKIISEENYVNLLTYHQFDNGHSRDLGAQRATWTVDGQSAVLDVSATSVLSNVLRDNTTRRADYLSGLVMGAMSNMAFGRDASTAGGIGWVEMKDMIAIGVSSRSENERAIAIGGGSKSKSYGGISIGAASLSVGHAAVAIGMNSSVVGDFGGGIAVGGDAKVMGASTIAIGVGSSGTGQHSIALGDDARVIETSSVAIGSKAKVTGANTIAVGASSSGTGERSIALGSYANASSYMATALGFDTKASNNYTVAVGTKAIASGDEAVAIGSYANASGVKAVALGSGSKASNRSDYAGYNPLTGKYAGDDANYIWQATTGVVSIGDVEKKITRQINGVAAGREDTDAVNVAQLKVLRQLVLESSNSFVQQDDSNGRITIGAETSGAAITLANKNGKGRTLSGLKDGALSDSSTEAVTGKQLFKVQGEITDTNDEVYKVSADVVDLSIDVAALTTSVDGLSKSVTNVQGNVSKIAQNASNYLGGGADILGGTAPTYTVQNKDYENVGAAFAGVDKSLTELYTNIENGVGNGLIEQEDSNSRITIGAKIGGTEITLANKDGEGRTLSGLKEGTLSDSSTEAVTGKQLYKVDSRLTETTGKVEGLTTSVTNVQGDVSKIAQNVSNYLGGGADLLKETAPTYKI